MRSAILFSLMFVLTGCASTAYAPTEPSAASAKSTTAPVVPIAPITAPTAMPVAPTVTSGASPTVSAAASPVLPSAPTAVPPVAAPTAPATTAVQPTTVPTARPISSPAADPGPVARITASDGKLVVVNVEVADNDQSMMVGLSKRQSMPEDAGMVFVFPSDVQVPFWMKDTWIDLSIAFIASDGKIVEIQDMANNTEDIHQPSKAYRYSLEVNEGFFKRNGINTGDKVEFQLGGR